MPAPISTLEEMYHLSPRLTQADKIMWSISRRARMPKSRKLIEEHWVLIPNEVLTEVCDWIERRKKDLQNVQTSGSVLPEPNDWQVTHEPSIQDHPDS